MCSGEPPMAALVNFHGCLPGEQENEVISGRCCLKLWSLVCAACLGARWNWDIVLQLQQARVAHKPIHRPQKLNNEVTC